VPEPVEPLPEPADPESVPKIPCRSSIQRSIKGSRRSIKKASTISRNKPSSTVGSVESEFFESVPVELPPVPDFDVPVPELFGQVMPVEPVPLEPEPVDVDPVPVVNPSRRSFCRQ